MDGGVSVELVDPDSTPVVMQEALPVLSTPVVMQESLPMLLKSQDIRTVEMNETSKYDPADLKRVVQEGSKSESKVSKESSGENTWRPEDAVIAVFDVDGTEQTVLVKFRPLGLKFHPRTPIVVKGFEKGAYGEMLGIQTGWTLKSLDGDDILGKQDFHAALAAMKDHLQHLPAYEKAVSAVFDVDGTEQTVLVKFRPLGLKFHPRTPIVVKGFEKGAYGEMLGIQTGWTLKSLDGDDILGKQDFHAALAAMKDHLQHLPAYGHQL